MNTTKARNLNCLYNVYLRSGMERMTDREATRRFGSEIWSRYAESIDHSEWCSEPECVEARRVSVQAWGGVPADPF